MDLHLHMDPELTKFVAGSGSGINHFGSQHFILIFKKWFSTRKILHDTGGFPTVRPYMYVYTPGLFKDLPVVVSSCLRKTRLMFSRLTVSSGRGSNSFSTRRAGRGWSLVQAGRWAEEGGGR